jgi:outer membrane protein OmpA-like peptidoglycan-associated protein
VPFKNGLVFESNRVTATKVKKRVSNKLKQIFAPEFAWDGAGYSKLYYIADLKNIRVDSIPKVIWKDKQLGYAEKMRASSNDNRKMISSYGYTPTPFNIDTNIQLFSKQFEDRYNIGAVSFTADGETAYYTRNGKKAKNGYMLEIWESNFEKGAWTPGKRLFFNNINYNYFHPAVTPDGKRLYYVTDEPTGLGGTDIFYVDKNEDGSWKATTNAGQDINTTGNELFPTFYDGIFFFSSNGHPGLGGLDIFRLSKDARGELSVKNMGYPINSDKDDLGLSIKGNTGFFSSNRNGSDDIYAFDYAQIFVNMSGQINLDGQPAIGKKVYLSQKDELGRVKIIDSAVLDSNSSYAFKMRPNKNYTIVAFDGNNNKFEQEVSSNDYVSTTSGYNKKAAVINIPLTEKELALKKQREAEALAKERASMSRVFAKTVDSLMKLTKDYVALHHPFNQSYIVQKDLNNYYKLIERVKRMNGRTIVIVSASDCNGSDEYNENLAQKRAKRVFKTLSALSNNNIVIKNVGEKELFTDCNEKGNIKADQLENRYSYVFILDQK